MASELKEVVVYVNRGDAKDVSPDLGERRFDFARDQRGGTRRARRDKGIRDRGSGIGGSRFGTFAERDTVPCSRICS
jgi:hypothetical protein